MEKSPDAFRTISEVSDTLATPAHVLRFWESRFPQIRPVKRAGGRRYYRPSDVALLSGIKKLLHDDGLTIRGVQRMLREQGIRYVAGLTSLGALEDAGDEIETVNIFDVDVLDDTVEEEAVADDVAVEEPVSQPELPFASPPPPAPVAKPASVAAAPVPPAPAPEPAPAAPEDRVALVARVRAMAPDAGPEQAAGLAAIYARLRDLRDRMAEANRRGGR